MAHKTLRDVDDQWGPFAAREEDDDDSRYESWRQWRDSRTVLGEAHVDRFFTRHSNDDEEIEWPRVISVTPLAAKALAESRVDKPLKFPSLALLPLEVAQELREYAGEVDVGIKELSEDLVRAFANRTAPLVLPNVSRLSDEVAELVADCSFYLRVEGLESISVGVAHALSLNSARHQQELRLPLIRSLSPEIAKALTTGGGALALNGLTTLCRDSAEAFITHTGRLSLNRVALLEPEAAEALGRKKGAVACYGLHELMDQTLARQLVAAHDQRSYYGVRPLTMHSLRRMSHTVAMVFGRYVGPLHFPSLDCITDEVYAALSDNPVVVLPRGVNITVVVSEDVIQSLTPERARLLAARPGRYGHVLDFRSLVALDVEAATVLSRSVNALSFPQLSEITPDVAQALASHRQALYFTGLTVLSPQTAAALAKSTAELHFPKLKSLNLETATAFAKYRGRLHLDGLQTLDPDVVSVLERHIPLVSLAGLGGSTARGDPT